MSLKDQLESVLKLRQQKSLLRSLTTFPSSSADFSSNDFLGLSVNSTLRSLFLHHINAFPRPPLGSTGSRLLDGNSTYADELDRFLADFHNAESALTFTSGFDANVGFFSCVPQRGDAIIIDEYIHASVHDGIRTSRAKSVVKFKHNDLIDLKRRLDEAERNIGKENNIFVSVESLYSMEGDIAPLTEIVEILDGYNAYLIVDEAHATGVFGPQGRGLTSEMGLENKVFARLHTFGKALASNGAAIVGPRYLCSYLVNYARPLIYSTFLPYSSLINTRCAYEVMSGDIGDKLRRHLRKLIHLFRSSLRIPPHMLLPSTSPIQGVIIPGNDKVVEMCKLIQSTGYNVKPIRSPTVPKGRERIRICIHASNTEEQIRGLVQLIEDCVNKHILYSNSASVTNLQRPKL